MLGFVSLNPTYGAISYQLSAISYQLSAISYQLSAISYQLQNDQLTKVRQVKPKIICKCRSASKAVKLFMPRSIRFVCDLGWIVLPTQLKRTTQLRYLQV